VKPIPVVARSKAWVSRLLAGTAGSNPAGDMDVCLVRVVCCLVEVYATGRFFVQGMLLSVCVCGIECHQVQ
jgi:hypothetical protein